MGPVDKLLSLEDLLQLQRDTGSVAGEFGAPKGLEFIPERFGSDRRPDPKLMAPKKPFKLDNLGDYQDQFNPQMMNFLQWLLSNMRGGMWGQPDRPDALMDNWLQQQMQKPQLPGWRG